MKGFTADYAPIACSTSRVTKTFAQPSLEKNNSKAGGAKSTINPEFKEFAQTRGWKMALVDEKKYP